MAHWLEKIYRRFAAPEREAARLEIVQWSRPARDAEWSRRVLTEPEPRPRQAPLGDFRLDDGDSDRF